VGCAHALDGINATGGRAMSDDELRQKALATIRAVWKRMSADERAVATLLAMGIEPVTQKTIAKSEPWIGTHPEHEDYDAETTTRMVREIVRRLRVDYEIPVLAGRSGYFLPERREQVQDFLNGMEREVKARNRASIETYQALKKSCDGLSSDYFDQQGDLFE
jgi:hypothetical protein